MALDQAKWFTKISSWVPTGFFFDQGGTQGESQEITDAVFQAMSAIFSQLQQDLEDQQAATFILESSAPILDLLGNERNYPRPTGMSDSDYAPLVQNCLFGQVAEINLETYINLALNNGTCFMIDNFNYGFFDDADTSETNGFLYYDDEWSLLLDITKWYNWWTVLIPQQTANATAVYAAIVATIQLNMAIGTTYDIVIDNGGLGELLTEAGGHILQEDGSYLDL